MDPPVVTLPGLVRRIIDRRLGVAPSRATLVGVSGIDGAGKGYVAARLAARLEAASFRIATVNADGWLELPHVRFDPARPAETFYRHGLRLDEMFARLVDPLCATRGIDLTMDFADETARTYRSVRVVHDDVDVVLIEGVYLFKRAYRSRFDLAAWIECSFETALERAIARAQEGLDPQATRAAYETIYVPAQRLHFERDRPREGADVVVVNDGRR